MTSMNAKRKQQEYIKKAYGVEPSWVDSDVKTTDELNAMIDRARMWYWSNHRFDSRKHKQWILDYLKKTDSDKETISFVKSNPITSFKGNGVYCRMYCLGAPLSDVHLESISDTVNKLIASGKLKKETDTKPKLSIQERIEQQVIEYLSILEEKSDAFLDSLASGEKFNFNVEEWLKANKVKSVQSKKIAQHFVPLSKELEEAVEGLCPQLNEGYSYLTKPKKKKYYKFVMELVNTCQNNVTPRKKRKTKNKTPEQLVSKVKYEEKNEEFKLTSIHPADIIGASKLIVFNTKYRELTIYNTLDPAGFIIKGTTIQNFSKDSSKSKKIRKPEGILPVVKTSGIRVINKHFNDLNTKSKTPTGRLNSSTIIMKVLK